MLRLNSRVTWLAALAVILLPLLAACGGTPAASPTDTPVAAAPAAATDTPAAPAAAAATNTPAAAAAAGATDTPAATAVPTVQATVVAGGEGCAANAPKVTWYIGLGTGADA